jgi:hypothetical protein
MPLWEIKLYKLPEQLEELVYGFGRFKIHVKGKLAIDKIEDIEIPRHY